MMAIHIKTIATACVVASLCACVQYPTETSHGVDHRPLVSFQFDVSAQRLSAARVMVDGQDSGSMADYAAGQGAMRVLPGNHVIRVVSGSDVLLEQHVFLADGAATSLSVR